MGNDLISVIIPAYNEEKYIAKVIDSVKSQTYPSIELIVISNGSNDKTTEISKTYTSNVYEIKEKSAVKALNLGIEKAKGEIISFLDADSYMKNDLLDKVCTSIKEGYVGGKAKIVPDRSNLGSKIYHNYVNFCSNLSQFLMHFNKNLQNGAGAFMFTDRENIQKLKSKYGTVFREDIETMYDVDFLRKLSKEGKIKFIKESHIVTSTRRFDKEGYIKRFFKDYIEYLSPRGKRRDAQR